MWNSDMKDVSAAYVAILAHLYAEIYSVLQSGFEKLFPWQKKLQRNLLV
jgi:hypothetical protein